MNEFGLHAGWISLNIGTKFILPISGLISELLDEFR
jgi:hypothetical protein